MSLLRPYVRNMTSYEANKQGFYLYQVNILAALCLPSNADEFDTLLIQRYGSDWGGHDCSYILPLSPIFHLI